jgi:succinyl-CoA synthetase alpha subunit
MMKIMKVEIGPIVHAHYIFHRQINRKKNKTKRSMVGTITGETKREGQRMAKRRTLIRTKKKGES